MDLFSVKPDELQREMSDDSHFSLRFPHICKSTSDSIPYIIATEGHLHILNHIFSEYAQ